MIKFTYKLIYILCGSFLGNAVGVTGIGTGTGTGTGNDNGSGADDIVATGARVFVTVGKAGGTGNGTGTGTGTDIGTEGAEGESAGTAEEYKTPLD